MYSFPDLEPVCCSMSSSNCCFLTYIQISQEAGKVVWYSHLFQSFPQFIEIHTVKGFGIVNKAEVDVFLEFSCFFDDPTDVGNLISGTSASSKSSLKVWTFTVHALLKSGLENLEHYFASAWDECNCAVVWRADTWSRKRQPTPVFLPGELHGQRSLVGYSRWGHKESDMTEQLSTAHGYSVNIVCLHLAGCCYCCC